MRNIDYAMQLLLRIKRKWDNEVEIERRKEKRERESEIERERERKRENGRVIERERERNFEMNVHIWTKVKRSILLWEKVYNTTKFRR